MKKSYFLLFLALAFLLTDPIKTNAQPVDLHDSLALVDLYKTNNGSSWNNHINWLTIQPVSSWYGITLLNGRVTQIALPNNNLTYVLPTSLGNLSELNLLNLAHNQLVGYVPPPISNLSKLASLDLQYNQLSSVIPSFLGNLTLLQSLKLNNNQLTGSIPAELSNLINLQSLDLSYNQLTGGIPGTFGNLSSLRQLFLNANQLTGGIPSGLGNLSNLLQLTVNNNLLTGTIPSSFANLSNLSVFILSNNRFTGKVPAFLGSLSNLTALRLSNNQFTDSLPSALGNLSQIMFLDVSKNFLTGPIPASFNNFSNLDTLDLRYNKFTFSGLELLAQQYNTPGHHINYSPQDNITVNQLGNLLSVTANGTLANNTYKWYLDGIMVATKTGDSTLAIPNSGNYSVDVTNAMAIDLTLHSNSFLQDSLALVDLYNNTNGPIWRISTNWLTNKPLSTWYGVGITNGRVTTVALNFNSVSGELPRSFYNLSNLQTLSLYVNGISGYISPDIGKFTQLTRLDFDENELTGSIPSSIGALKALQFFDFEDNQLTDTIPNVFAGFNQLISFGFSNNQLTGNIPSTLASIPTLKYIYLNNNKLTGTIPASLGNITGLNSILVNDNKLSGPLPSSLLNSYYQLSLYNNNFTFNGMEGFEQKYTSSTYSPQANIAIKQSKNSFYVTVGGTPSNNTFSWYKNGSLIATKTADSTLAISSAGKYTVSVTNNVGNKLTLISDTLYKNGDSLILPAKQNIEYANVEYTDTTGWTHYYFNNNTPLDISDDTLLLSLKKNSQNIGTIGDGTFAVKLVATVGAGSNTGIQLTNPLITNASGYWVMNRFWQVTPTKQPTKSIGIRFYYNNQDVADVNGSYPTHDLTNQKLIFYKGVNGNPDPTSNLTGATKLISILPNSYASDTTWSYHQLSDTTQYAEFSVSGFSGGGGGNTGDGKALTTPAATVLPVALVTFTGRLSNGGAVLNWQTTGETNTVYFNVLRSTDGIHFSKVGSVVSNGNSVGLQSYSFTDAPISQDLTEFYRLQVVDKDGSLTFSNIIALSMANKDGLSIFPNPVKNTLFVQLKTSQAKKELIMVTDLQGRILLEQQFATANGSNRFSFNVSGLANGVYLLIANGAQQGNIMFIKE